MKYKQLICLFILLGYSISGLTQTPFPEGDGKQLVTAVCSGCHGLSYITDSHRSAADWEDIVTMMISYGAAIRPNETQIIIQYLSENFSPDSEHYEPVGEITSSNSALERDTIVTDQFPDFLPVNDQNLKDPESSDWLRWRRDHNASGFSPLNQINQTNVKNLHLAWTWAMEAGVQEQEPIIYQGVMYLPHSNGLVQALHAENGQLIWEYQHELPDGMGAYTTRNIAIYQDKIYLTTEDAYLIALDARNGKPVWQIMTGNPDDRVDYSAGPIAGDGKIFAGQTCGTGTRSACSVSAHDAKTGELLWQRESVAGPGDPQEHNASWGNVPHDMRRKASFWLTGSYDPELGLVYWTTASPYPYPEILKGETKGGDLLYSNSILALDADTGAIRWHFQMQPRDNFDMDHQDNPILADIEIGGVTRKAVFVLGKPGILWAIDRDTGKYLWHRQLVKYQNLYENIDPETGEIKMNEAIIPQAVGDVQFVCPGMRGGKLFQTNAYNPVTNTIYSPVSNTCNNFEVVSLNTSVSGVNYSEIFHMPDTNELVGKLAAVSASTGEVLWTHDQRAALGSVLTTAGNLVFTGDLHRYFKALDAETGRILWEVPLSGPVTGYPVSYAVNGKQFIAVAVGGGTAGTNHLARLYPELKSQHGSNILMVFSLGD